jgi:nucleotide-binding universal stress UspA family protein
VRILLCTDGSNYGQEALRFGALLARNSSEPATLLGVVEHATDRAEIERAIEEGKQWLVDGPTPRTKVRIGHAAEEILDEAKPDEYDLVVVGARGRRGITRFLLGSTSERIARHAGVPVLIVRGAHPEVRRILVCTGGQAPGLDVVSFGGRVAQLAGAEVTVLHVMSQLVATPVLPRASTFRGMPQTPAPPTPSHFQPGDLEASADELMAHGTREGTHLKQGIEILSNLGVPARALVRHGLVVDEISDEACEGDYDLVIVGSHFAEGWMRLLLKSVEPQIIGYCHDRPILVVKPWRRE